ncbi:hypothetical protein D3C72_1077740 [compost metagenome]
MAFLVVQALCVDGGIGLAGDVATGVIQNLRRKRELSVGNDCTELVSQVFVDDQQQFAATADQAFVVVETVAMTVQ